MLARNGSPDGESVSLIRHPAGVRSSMIVISPCFPRSPTDTWTVACVASGGTAAAVTRTLPASRSSNAFIWSSSLSRLCSVGMNGSWSVLQSAGATLNSWLSTAALASRASSSAKNSRKLASLPNGPPSPLGDA